MSGEATERQGPSPLPLVVGVGNERRGDDRSGLDVVRTLAPRLGGRVEVVECADDLTELLELWSGREEVIVVDGVRSGRPAGTVVRFEVGARALPTLGPTSTHGLSLGEVVGLGRSLGKLPRRLVIYGIEVGDVALNEGLSAPVARAVAETAARIAEELLPEPAPRPRA